MLPIRAHQKGLNYSEIAVLRRGERVEEARVTSSLEAETDAVNDHVVEFALLTGGR
jgi:hypothetical protein